MSEIHIIDNIYTYFLHKLELKWDYGRRYSIPIIMWEVFELEWVLLLLILMCPLMMMFMHRGHNHGPHKEGHSHDHMNHNNEDQNHFTVSENSSNDVKSLTDYKIEQLEGEVEFLKNQNETLQRKLESLTEKTPQDNHNRTV